MNAGVPLMNAATAAHEARHAAAGLMLGVPLREARADNPDPSAAGYVQTNIDGLDPDLARNFALLILAGRIGDEDWPPSWPPSAKAQTADERQLGVLVPYLDLGQSGWHELTAAAYRLSSEPEFVRLEDALAGLLEQGHVLDEHTLRHVHAIATQGAKMQHKTVEASATATELGEFSAIAAAYSVDRDGEQIARGAFKQTIARWQASGKRVPVHWNHSGAAADIIGAIDPASMRETAEGLFVQGRLDLEGSEVAREAWRSMKANAVAFSFGFLTTKSRKRSDGVLELQEIDMFEVSIVPGPANPDTRIVSMKSIEDEHDAEVPSHRDQVREAERLGVIPPDPVRVRAREEMLALLLTAPDEKSLSGDKAQRERAKALGVDHRPIQVASFEI